MATIIHVSVWNLAGESLELDVDPHTTITSLKCEISKCWHVPDWCQELLQGSHVLQGLERICDLQVHKNSTDGQLNLTMVVVQNELCRQILSRSSSVRRSAISALGEWARADYKQALVVLSACLEHSDVQVRKAAATVLADVTPSSDDEHAVAALNVHCRDCDRGVRSVIMKALAFMAKFGNESAGASLGDCCEDPDPAVRADAVHILTEVAPKNAVKVIRSRLKDSDAQIRAAAIKSLTQLTPKGEHGHVSSLCDLARDSDAIVREAALQALVIVAPQGNRQAQNALLLGIQDSDPHVRRSAAKALTRVVMKGDVSMVAALCSRASDSDVVVQSSLIETLGHIACRGDASASDALCAQLTSGQWEVQQTAAKALKKVAAQGDATTATALQALIRSDAPWAVRQSAATTLQHIAPELGKIHVPAPPSKRT